MYLRDSESGDFWSPTPGPVANNHPTLVRHGQGYSVFESVVAGIAQEMTVFVPREGQPQISSCWS